MNSLQSGLPLKGTEVVFIRAAGHHFCQRLRALGARCFNLPVITVHPLPDTPALQAALSAAEQSDAVIFASPNAVRFCYQIRPDFAPCGQVFGQGPATQAALRRHGVSAHIPVSGYTSEDLLANPWFTEIRGKQIVRISGIGGNDVLLHNLLERCALATTLALYERRPGRLTRRHFESLNHCKKPVLVITSAEILQILPSLVPIASWQWLRQQHLLVSSPRLEAAAQHAGFDQITRAASAAWADLRASLLAMAAKSEPADRITSTW